MRFIIRDDDLNYFSKPADIERWYADIFAEKIPVGFSAIPFVNPRSDVYVADARFAADEYPVGDNTELVAYVKNQPLIEILQHGTTHETVNGVFEYAQQVPLREVARGRQELERAFGKPVRVFVPPHDWINTSGVRSIEAAGMDIIRGRGAGLRNWLPRWQYLVIFLKMLLYRFPRYISTAPPVYPHILDFGAHKEACSYRLEDKDVLEGLERACRENGIFVVVTHLHYYTDEKKALLKRLIGKARGYGAEFVQPSSLFKGA